MPGENSVKKLRENNIGKAEIDTRFYIEFMLKSQRWLHPWDLPMKNTKRTPRS
jgi:hypothetical protein